MPLAGCFAQATQPANDYIRPPAFGISFFFTDYITPQRIRSASLTEVIRNNQLAKIKDMAPGIGLTYFKGIRNHIDFAGTLNMSFVNVPLPNSSNTYDNDLLLEGDAAVNLKMLTDKHWVNPYLIVGIGASKYKNFWGAFMPLGGGIKVNFFNEAAIFITTQYRVPVTTETANYHFVHTIGIAGIIGQKK